MKNYKDIMIICGHNVYDNDELHNIYCGHPRNLKKQCRSKYCPFISKKPDKIDVRVDMIVNCINVLQSGDISIDRPKMRTILEAFKTEVKDGCI